MKLIDKVILNNNIGYYEIYTFESKKEKEEFIKKRERYKKIRRKIKEKRKQEGYLTKEELIEYNKILDRLYKPTGINIFDLC